MINLPSDAALNAAKGNGELPWYTLPIEEHGRNVGARVWAINKLATHLATHHNLRGMRGEIIKIDNDHFEGIYWRPLLVRFGRVDVWIHPEEVR